MAEHQTIEWKESWHDEFLEWICGYANAYGETLYIGKNDNGDVVGLSDKDRKKLLESILNKITNTMGIVADVNLRYENLKREVRMSFENSFLPSASPLYGIFTPNSVNIAHLAKIRLAESMVIVLY